MADRELLFRLTRDDFEIQTFRSGGKGGQNQNTRNTGCRIKHPPSGAVGEARDHRTFDENRKAAFLRMAESGRFRMWHAETVAKLLGRLSPEARVEQAMQPGNIRIEVRDAAGKWITIDPVEYPWNDEGSHLDLGPA